MPGLQHESTLKAHHILMAEDCSEECIQPRICFNSCASLHSWQAEGCHFVALTAFKRSDNIDPARTRWCVAAFVA